MGNGFPSPRGEVFSVMRDHQSLKGRFKESRFDTVGALAATQKNAGRMERPARVLQNLLRPQTWVLALSWLLVVCCASLRTPPRLLFLLSRHPHGNAWRHP
jgi:hypothetical protein